MDFEPQAIPDVILMTPKVFGDERGFFMETFRKNQFEEHCGRHTFVQENHSSSATGILRGLHYQLNHPQGKLVRVTQGEVFDVAVDLRKYSHYFGQWVGLYLSDQNKQALWIPPGFAHGFLVTRGQAQFQYKCTDYYAPGDECFLHWNDPELGIDWPLEASSLPTVSEKDNAADPFRHAFVYRHDIRSEAATNTKRDGRLGSSV